MNGNFMTDLQLLLIIFHTKLAIVMLVSCVKDTLTISSRTLNGFDRYGLVQDMAIKVIQKPKDELIEFSVGYRNVDDLLYAEDQVKKVLDHNQWVMSQIILT
jgi:hypothetical protein